MSMAGMIVGNYGQTIEITVTEDGTAADVSTFGTAQYVFASPGGTVTTVTAAFKTDGTDGVLTYTVGSALLTTAGDWMVQPKLSKAGQVAYAEIVPFTVGRVLA